MKPEVPEIVYKYRNWTNKFHKSVLIDNELYLSAPSDFNDPFDCKITKNHHLLDTPEKIEKYIKIAIENNIEHLREHGKDIDQEKDKLRKRLQNLDLYQKEHEKISEKLTNKYLGVLSLSSRWDSILMWSHYGDFHKGYCVGLDEKKLRNTKFFGMGGTVSYTAELPVLSPLDKEDLIKTSFYQTHYKAKEWEYEKEYRLTKLYFDKPDEKPNRIIKIPDNFYREVVIGFRTSKENREQIISYCDKKKIDVYQAVKELYQYKIKRELVIRNGG